ncbi:MAG TPA: TolC family protein [Opitutaceae bacterium]
MSRLRLPVLLPCLAVFGLLAPVRGADTLRLTLADALDQVERTSLDVLLAREAVRQTIEQANQERAALLPDISLNATQVRRRTASVGGALVSSGINNRFDANLSGQLEVLNPQNIANYQAARLGIKVSELDLAATRESILASVADTYFQHLRNLSRIDVLDANIARARALLDLARRQTDAGVATQIDVTRAEAQLAAAEQARLQQDTVVQTSELTLKRLLALELATPVELTVFNARRVEAPAFAASLEEVAFERRADFLQATRLLEQNELEVRAAKFGRLPSLAFTGSYGYASAEAFNGEEAKVWSGGVNLSMPVFDGLRTRSLTRLALSRRRAQELRVQDLRLRIGAEVRLAAQDARSRFAQIAVAERSLRLAEDELSLAQKRFEQGVADNREIVDAQNNLAIASDNFVEAIYQYNIARVELARVQGSVRAIIEEVE